MFRFLPLCFSSSLLFPLLTAKKEMTMPLCICGGLEILLGAFVLWIARRFWRKN